MAAAWHRADPRRFEREAEEVSDSFPDLTVAVDNGLVFISGVFPIVDGQRVIDRYRIRIDVPADHPHGVPSMKETGGRIPRTPEHHMNPADGTACLFVPDERWIHFPVNSSLLDFLNDPVRSFLVSQSVFEATGTWPFGARSHGIEGVIESYSELLGAPDPKVILAYLEILTLREAKGHLPCPCGSGKRLRDCHQDQVNDLRSKIQRHVAENSHRQVAAHLGVRSPRRITGRRRRKRG